MAKQVFYEKDKDNFSDPIDEEASLIPLKGNDSPPPSQQSTITATGLKVLALLAFQNCSKNLIMRYAVQDKPDFLYSAAVIGSELTKLTLSVLYIILVDRGSLSTIFTFLKLDWWNAVLLTVPAAVYNFQQTLEYVALSNLDASIFSVLVQSKMLCTAIFATTLMGVKLRKAQVVSLVLLTTGVMLANIKCSTGNTKEDGDADVVKGTMATIGISFASGFAAVYTEKVIKTQKATHFDRSKYSLAYMQVQLAGMSLIVMGAWAVVQDYEAIIENGLWHNVNGVAGIAIVNSALGGLTVAAVLKFADSVLKGYATACSVLLTGILSSLMFGTQLSFTYLLGMSNVVCSVLLYNMKGLDENAC